MRLTEILKPQNIKAPLQCNDKNACIGELVQLLAANGEVNDAEKVLEAVLNRESTRTTGIGHGLAIPHGKTVGTDHLVMAIGKPAEPVDFQAIDGRPVTLIWLLTSPPDKTGPHITALARISRMMIDDAFRSEVNEARTASEVFNLISEKDEQM